MKLPNGYGTVFKLSGNRRNPYIARVTVGWTDDGKQIREVVGYYPTRQAALNALAEYNTAPYDISKAKMTFADVYNEVMKDSDSFSLSAIKTYKAGYKYFADIHEMPFKDIKFIHLQKCVDKNKNGYQSRRLMKKTAAKMYSWAIKYDLTDKDYSKMIELGDTNKTATERQPFSSEEIQTLWKYADEYYIKVVLVLIYTGVRINELLNLLKENVYLDEQYFKVIDSKTAAGVREVPIADKILPFFKYFYGYSETEYLMSTATNPAQRLNYDNWQRKIWREIMKNLDMKHTTHETRHTCISQMTIHNVNPTTIKFIVGHKSIMSLTEKIYTHIPMSEKIKAVNTIGTELE